jgi:hypothetical protein
MQSVRQNRTARLFWQEVFAGTAPDSQKRHHRVAKRLTRTVRRKDR